MNDKRQIIQSSSQVTVRELVSMYGQRTGKGSTKISTDISIFVPDIGWFVSKDDLDKWFKRRNKLGERKFEAICAFIKTDHFLKIVPEANSIINVEANAIQAGLNFKQFICNPLDHVDYSIDDFAGYYEVVCGHLLRKALPFSMYVSYNFYFKKLEGYDFFIAHLYSFWRRNKGIWDHTSGFLFFKPNKEMYFKGYDRITKEEINIPLAFIEGSVDESKHVFWLRRIDDMPDKPDPDEEPWKYRAKSFFDKVEWSVIPRWK